MKRIALFILSLAAANALSAQLLPEREMAPVAVPPLPTALHFAGEAVPLVNFDTRESLTRELLVTSYIHSRTMLTLTAATRYFPVIEPILARHGVPRDFVYLCMAESGLDPEAVSPAGAAGIWQIMAGTARDLGLTVGGDIDQRFDVERATEAACQYFLASYERFGSWTLVAAAYNAGNAGVARRIETQGVKNYYDLYLPAETMRYVFRILSLKLLSEHPAMYGYRINPGDYMRPLTGYTVQTVTGSPVDWSAVARSHGTNYKMLRALNPWIRTYSYPNKERRSFEVRVPGPEMRKK